MRDQGYGILINECTYDVGISVAIDVNILVLVDVGLLRMIC